MVVLKYSQSCFCHGSLSCVIVADKFDSSLILLYRIDLIRQCASLSSTPNVCIFSHLDLDVSRN